MVPGESHLEDVLLSGQSVGAAAHVEGDDGQRWDFVAAHHVLKAPQDATAN